MLLQLCTWPEVESYLARSQGLILPIGSTEQHGPNGLIGTDALCAEAVAKGVGDATQALVGPTINVGMALHHTGFPGSMSLRPSTLIALVQDYLKPLVSYGFTRFFFINGHGGNVATLKAAFAETYAALAEAQVPQAGAVRCAVANWYMCRSVYTLAKEFYGDQEGSHAAPGIVPDAVGDEKTRAEADGDLRKTHDTGNREVFAEFVQGEFRHEVVSTAALWEFQSQ